MGERWQDLTAADLVVPTTFIPETMTAWTALQGMRSRQNHLAIVVDEYGGTAGLVTLEDLLEEVVGEIYDEGEKEEMQEEGRKILAESNGRFIIQVYMATHTHTHTRTVSVCLLFFNSTSHHPSAIHRQCNGNVMAM